MVVTRISKTPNVVHPLEDNLYLIGYNVILEFDDGSRKVSPEIVGEGVYRKITEGHEDLQRNMPDKYRKITTYDPKDFTPKTDYYERVL